MSREVRAARRISCHWRLLSMPWFADGRREEGDGVMLLLPYAVSEKSAVPDSQSWSLRERVLAVLRAPG